MKIFLLEGTDADQHIPSHLGTHAVGSAFESLYCSASWAGRKKAVQYFLQWTAFHKDPSFNVVAVKDVTGQPREEIWDWDKDELLT